MEHYDNLTNVVLLSIYLSKFQILFILVNTLIYLKFRKCATAFEKIQQTDAATLCKYGDDEICRN